MDQEKINAYKEKLKKAEEAKRAELKHEEMVDSVRSTADANKMALKSVTKDIAKSSDIDEVIKQLKEAQLASYLNGATQKSAVVLADSTDLGEAVSGLGSKLDALAKSLEGEKTDLKLIKTVKEELATVVNALNQDTDKELVDAIESLRPLIEGINIQPVVVPAPKVTVESSKVDLAPLNATLIKHLSTKPKELDLLEYKAQDLMGDDSFQYVGFVSPNGSWYIIENDIESSSLRYKFGTKDYTTAWSKANGHSYRLLNEAIREI